MGWRLPGLAGLALGALLAACSPAPSPASVEAGVVRTPTAAGDRVVLLTSQWNTFKTGTRSSRRSYTDLLVDLRGFDAETGQPVRRRRLERDRNGVKVGRAVPGAEDGVVWIIRPDRLTAVAAADGEILADAARIEAASPQLAGVMPTERRFHRFDKGGLALTTQDGRAWRTGPDGPDIPRSSTAPTD